MQADRIAAAFRDHGKRAALMPYLMAGFPDVDASRAIGAAYADAGADLVEVGVPFSDPLADGPVIHAAGTVALSAGATTDDALAVAEAVGERLPAVLMCYSNLVLRRGAVEFARRLADGGISGLIVPDLPLEEAPALLQSCDDAGVALVPLVAPTTPDTRLAAIGRTARGFVYTVSVTGTTGERAELDPAALLARVRAHATVPVALGFGIATPQQAAAAAAAGADGVIVGSRLVRAAAEGEDIRALVAELAAALAADPV